MVFPYIYSPFPSSPATAHRAQQEKNSSETDSGSNCDKVSIHVYTCALSSLVFVFCLLWWSDAVCFFSREMDNFRTETVTADMRLSQRRRRTWRCSGGEGSAVGLSSVIKLHGRWTVKSCGAVHLIFYLLAEIIHLICLFASILSPSAGTLWTSCWKPREPTWRSCSAYCKSVLTPKNGYSSLWPEFHVCLFFLLCFQGYASEMDNPAMVPLMPAPLQNKKEVLFGNMPEIYHFHRRWRSAICLSLMISTHCDLSCC